MYVVVLWVVKSRGFTLVPHVVHAIMWNACQIVRMCVLEAFSLVMQEYMEYTVRTFSV